MVYTYLINQIPLIDTNKQYIYICEDMCPNSILSFMLLCACVFKFQHVIY